MNSVNYFKALADETRLRLLNLFRHHELNVNEVVEIMEMGQSRISRHLKILTDSDLITFRRSGLWTFYSAVDNGAGGEFIRAIGYLFEQDSIFSEDLRRARRIKEERSRQSTQFFNAIAEDWEGLKKEIIGSFDLNDFIQGHIPRCHAAVDLGCGTGDLLPYLKVRADVVIGVDRSANMLEEARRRFSTDESQIDLRIGDIEHLPLRDGEADLGIINMVLHHLPSPQSALTEIHRVLRAGSSFIIVDFLRHRLEDMRQRYGDRWLGFSREEMVRWLGNAGFQPGKIDYFDLNKGLKGFLLPSIKIEKEKGV
jgi:ubiquinone/menaquinone biosynthesis C-methylase UbiE